MAWVYLLEHLDMCGICTCELIQKYYDIHISLLLRDLKLETIVFIWFCIGIIFEKYVTCIQANLCAQEFKFKVRLERLPNNAINCNELKVWFMFDFDNS
jgi:hypothetical protein